MSGPAPVAAMQQRRLDAVLFDMDGVVTDTAPAHASAWKRLFDTFLEERARARGEPFVPFDARADYREHVDGRPRLDGIRTFLAARGIELPEGGPDDDPAAETVHALGRRKNRYFREWLEANRVRRFPGTIALIGDLRRAGIRCAVFTSSRNAEAVLESAGVAGLFDVKVDGNAMAEKGLPGKPDPAGVEAGRRGGFALVVGVDRGRYGKALGGHGADLVVRDLGELRLDAEGGLTVNTLATVPLVWEREQAILDRLHERTPVVFLDYDGTLTPIVEDHTKAVLAGPMRAQLAELARHFTVAVVSGRDVDALRPLIGLDALYYAGSHGFEISGPGGWHETLGKGEDALPELDEAERALCEALDGIEGHAVERKRFSIAIHYRRAAEGDVARIEQAVDRVAAHHPRLRKGLGKKVFRLQPDVDWDKGHAVLWLLERLGLDRPGVVPVYVGDDVTDEDAFRVLADRGLAVVVRGEDDSRATAARFALEDPEDVRRFLGLLIALAGKEGKP